MATVSTNATMGGQVCNATEGLPDGYRYSLLSLYTLVLVVGICSNALMADNLKSSIRSVTTMAVNNLIVVHFVFLITVPFRLYYYGVSRWALGEYLCRFISVMIHAHMYIAFIFYIIILVIRYLAFFSHQDQLHFYRNLHALAASVAVWITILVVTIPVIIKEYGTEMSRAGQCFQFGSALNDQWVSVINYLLSAVQLLLTLILLAVQLWILGAVYSKHGKAAIHHQEFRAQVKSLCFLMVILICFAPYHLFRFYYVTQFPLPKDSCLQDQNEIFLAVTAFSCFDMLIFISGKQRGSTLPLSCFC